MPGQPLNVPLLLLTGPVGVGKSSVLSALGELLAEHGRPHALVDLDALSEYFPRLPGDRFGTTVALRNLAAVWTNYHAAGAERLVLARVIEARRELLAIQEAVPGARITVCRLTASVETLQQRVRRRELGAGLDWHLARAAELAAHFAHVEVADFVVDTENRPPAEIAAEVVARWQAIER